MRAFLVDEIVGFLNLSNISAKNIHRLEELETETAEDVVLLASLRVKTSLPPEGNYPGEPPAICPEKAFIAGFDRIMTRYAMKHLW